MPEKLLTLRGTAQAQLAIDRKAGIINNVSIIAKGPAVGHGFSIDSTMLRQVFEQIKAAGSVRCRVTHPNGDGLLHLVGHIDSPRLDADAVRGRLVLGPHAKNSPQGNLYSYLLDLAQNDPRALGLSIVFRQGTFEPGPDGTVYGRSAGVQFIDLVDQPAANPSGLLSQPSTKRKLSMNTEIKSILVDMFGLSSEASDDQAQAFFDALSPENQDKVKAAAGGDDTGSMSAGSGDDFVALEQKRVNGIRALGKTIPGVDDQTINLAISQRLSAQEANAMFLRKLSDTHQAIGYTRGTVDVGVDMKLSSLAGSVSDAIALRFGTKLAKPSPAAEALRGHTLLEVGRRWLTELGVRDAQQMSNAKLLKTLFRPQSYQGIDRGKYIQLAMSTSDFDHVLADAINKGLRVGYAEAPRTWSQWARRATAPDFKTIRRVTLSTIGTPTEISEGSPYVFQAISDVGETYVLKKHGLGLKLTWSAIVNDDLDAFARSFQTGFASACRRLEDDVAYAAVTSNPTMTEDSTALFDASHSNIAIGSSYIGAPSVATLGYARARMMRMTDPKGNVLNIQPMAILVPAEILTTTENMVASLVDPSKSNAAPNADFIRNLVVVGEPRLSANSTTTWYLVANPANIDTVEVCFLDEEPEPVTETETDFHTDDQLYKCRHTVAARAIDFRGMFRNAGA